MVMMANRVAYTLDSTLDSVNKVEQTAEQLAVKVGFAEDDLHKITMSVREAAVNAVLHGNQFDACKRIFLNAQLCTAGLVISIRDEGNGCHLETVPDPLAPDNLLRDSGRGILLIRACMDEVIWRRTFSGGTEIIMTKRRST